MTHEPPDGEFQEPDDSRTAPSGLASVILVDRHEDLAAICGRIDTAPTFAVVLQAVDGNRPLTSELGMRRLLRHAQESGRVVAIATGDTALAARARQVGIPVARRPEHVRWDAAGRRTIRLAGRSIVPPRLGRYAQAVLGLALTLFFGGLTLTLAPSATVSVAPPVETLITSVVITASPSRTSIDFTTLQVPATTVSARERVTLAVPTTGKTMVATKSAVAQVVITNPTAADVALAAGAAIQAGAGGPVFELDLETVVPAGNSVTRQATAAQPGPAGNVAAGALSGFQDSRFKGLQVTNPAPAAGGAAEERPAVDANDAVAIRKLANSLDSSESIRRLVISARPRDAVFLKTAEVVSQAGELSAPVGAPADVLLLPVEVTVKALAVESSVLEAVAKRVLSPERSAGAFIPGSVRAVETGASQAGGDEGTIRTEIQVSGEFARDVTREVIRDLVKGKSPASARSTLANQYGIQDARVRVSPGWAPWLPRFGFRISVELRGQESAANRNPPGAAANVTPTTTEATPNPGR